MLEREAAWRSQYEQLCNKPVSMNAKDFVSESPMDLCGSPVGMGLSLFHCACLVGRTEVVKECLLGSKLDPNLLAYVAAFSLDAVHRGKGDTGSDAYALPTITGLELAAAANHGDVCSVLLSSGALVGRALHIAVTNGSAQAATAIISSLREGKNDLVLRRLTNGVMEAFSPLALSILGNHAGLTQLLLESGADPLQELSALARRILVCRPSYVSISFSEPGADCNMLQFALRLGSGRRNILEAMQERMDGVGHGSASQSLLDKGGTLCARAACPAMIGSNKVYPSQIWDLLRKADEGCAKQVGKIFADLQRTLYEQVRQ